MFTSSEQRSFWGLAILLSLFAIMIGVRLDQEYRTSSSGEDHSRSIKQRKFAGSVLKPEAPLILEDLEASDIPVSLALRAESAGVSITPIVRIVRCDYSFCYFEPLEGTSMAKFTRLCLPDTLFIDAQQLADAFKERIEPQLSGKNVALLVKSVRTESAGVANPAEGNMLEANVMLKANGDPVLLNKLVLEVTNNQSQYPVVDDPVCTIGELLRG